MQDTAEIAQLVEHNLAKVGVASSSLVFRSKSKRQSAKIVFFDFQENEIRTSDPEISPFRGRGYKQQFAKKLARSVGSGLVFRSKTGGWRNQSSFLLSVGELRQNTVSSR